VRSGTEGTIWYGGMVGAEWVSIKVFNFYRSIETEGANLPLLH